MSNRDPLLGQIKVDISYLFLDPNNPRLGEQGPGYENAKALFDEDLQKDIFKKLIGSDLEKDPYRVEELTSTMIKKGWRDNVEPIWVWESREKKGIYVVVEGNRRTTCLKHICGPYFNKITKDLENATNKNNRNLITKFQNELNQINSIIEKSKNITVSPMSASNENDLKEDLLDLLSLRHVNGAIPWKNDASDMWLYRSYRKRFIEKYGEDKDLYWDDNLIAPLSTNANITDVKCKQKLRSISWFEDFKIRYSNELPVLPNGKKDEFTNRDYYLFEQLSTNTIVRDKILKCSSDHVTLTDKSAEAVFKWVFKKPSHLDAEKNTNKFFAHRCVGHLAKMKRYDDTNTTTFSSTYDIENPDSATNMRDIYSLYTNAAIFSDKSTVLEGVVQQLKKIDIGQIEDEGDSIKEYLVTIRDLTIRIIGHVEKPNG